MVSPFSSHSSTLRRSRKSHGSKDNKNPFSSSGLDKFSALLAEHEEKRRKIFAEMDAENLTLVRFIYTNSNQCVPVLIKAKEGSSQRKEVEEKKVDQDFKDKTIIHESKFSTESKVNNSEKEPKRSDFGQDKKPCKLEVKLHRMKRPSHYLPVTVILILVLLALFGRSVAILCTCIGWYMVPVIKGRKSHGEILRKKKDYARKLSNETPRRRDTAAFRDKFPCLAAHWQS